MPHREEIVRTVPASVRVHVSIVVRVLSILGIIEFLFFGWMAYSDTGQFGIALVFLLFAALCGYVVLLTFSTIDADAQGLTVSAVHSAHHIDWAEVEVIETNGPAFLLRGGDKRLAFNLTMAGAGKQALLAFMGRVAQERHIQVQPLRNPFVSQRNTRVR